jgi:hypothetical protein
MFHKMNPFKSDTFFRVFLNVSMFFLCMDRKCVARMFGCSFSTIDRWKRGENAPHPFMRRNIYLRLISRGRL